MSQESMVAIENTLFRMDIIGWLDFLYGLLRYGRLQKFGWIDTSGYAVEDVLRRYNIHAHGRAIAVHLVPDRDGKKRREMHRWMWVNRKQARLAEYVLCRAGLSLTTKMLDTRNVQWAAKHNGRLPPPWEGGKRTRARTPIEAIFDVFGDMFRD